MTTRAENDPRFSRRFLYMGIGAIAFAIYCLYDGFIGYPYQRERALALQELLEEGRLDDWEELASQRNWPLSTSGLDPPKTEGDIIMQFVMAGIAGVAAVVLFSIPLRARGRWIEASDTGISSSWGQSFNYDQVAEVNKRQWRSKGIAKITYLEGTRKRQFVIDDYKFDRYRTDAILYELEQQIDPGLITNGPPEPPPGEAAESNADPAADESVPETPDARA